MSIEEVKRPTNSINLNVRSTVWIRRDLSISPNSGFSDAISPFALALFMGVEVGKFPGRNRRLLFYDLNALYKFFRID